MEKIIKKIGNSYMIILDKEDRRINNLAEGDVVNIEIFKIKSLKKKIK